MGIHQNSIDAFESNRASGQFSKRQWAIIKRLREGPMTDHDLAKSIQCPLSGITGARNTLMRKGIVKTYGNASSPYGTKRTTYSLINQEVA